MKKNLLAVAGFAVFLASAAPANAISFLPANGTLVDFGDVTVGTTATTTFAVTWSHDGSDGYSLHYILGDSVGSLLPFRVVKTTAASTCATAGLACGFSLTFSPTALGFVSASTASLVTSSGSGMIVFQSSNSDASDVIYNITLQGTGVSSAVPLPAALPLFASGLGAFGLLGWRKKRKKAATAAA